MLVHLSHADRQSSHRDGAAGTEGERGRAQSRARAGEEAMEQVLGQELCWALPRHPLHFSLFHFMQDED